MESYIKDIFISYPHKDMLNMKRVILIEEGVYKTISYYIDGYIFASHDKPGKIEYHKSGNVWRETYFNHPNIIYKFITYNDDESNSIHAMYEELSDNLTTYEKDGTIASITNYSDYGLEHITKYEKDGTITLETKSYI